MENLAMENSPRTSAEAAEPRELSHPECWALLGSSGIGHLAFRSQPVGVDIVPINYVITRRQLFFRSGPGTKLEELALHPYVAFQVDQLQDGRWSSVVVKGKAVRLAADAEIERSGILDLVPAQPGRKSNFVRITPDAVTGRTFAAQ
jgi:nitroimidazol reductase NimA-like FMN-containing flavoprotein (pyridoxamine 5'-phosphate oxidase superfamily)